MWTVLALMPYALGASCISGTPEDPAAERKECEAVCAVEAECELRTEDACLAALCDETGFRTVTDGDAEIDLLALSSNDCLREAADCAAAVLCSCPDACARVDECTGAEDPACEDTCGVLVEQDPGATYTENRCKMESTCGDLPACGAVSG